jgi:hypothetical protein
MIGKNTYWRGITSKILFERKDKKLERNERS